MQLGIMIEGQEGLTWERWRHIATMVEDLGFESLWRSDHFFSLMGQTEREALETWVSLTDLASRTSRLRFGPLVCSMTFRHPSLLARMAAAVDQLSGGRLVLGVGAGWNVAEHEAFGIPFPPIKRRMDDLEDGIEVIKRLWTGDSVSYDGRHTSLKNAVSHPVPAQRPHPPLLVGGGGEKRTLRIVAKHADEWNAINMLPAAYRAKTEVLLRHCHEVDRDPATISRSMMCAFVVGRDDAGLRRHAEGLQRMIPRLAATPTGSLPETLRSLGWLAGSPAEVVEQLFALKDAGVERVMLQHHDQANDEVVRLIAEEVMPAIAG